MLEIPAKWQTALQQSGSVGEIIGLMFAGYLADRVGWKKTLCGMMIFLTGFLFLFAFPKNLATILAGNILCGESLQHQPYLMTDYEDLQPRLEGLRKAHAEDLVIAADLERRVANVLKLYTGRVCLLSIRITYLTALILISRLMRSLSCLWSGMVSSPLQKIEFGL